MGLLKCQLFNDPPAVRARLERCLLNDGDHVTPGSRGEHVRKIQTALNRLSAGPGRPNFDLEENGVYGPGTAAAVKKYKAGPHGEDSKPILQPWQKVPDDIVGKRTIKALDDEMDILENESPAIDLFVSMTMAGAPHDHSRCPGPPRVKNGPYYQGRAQHLGTPINPKGFGRKINIYGEGETDYLNFEDYATEIAHAGSRPVTSDRPPPSGRGLPDNCASDICIRDSPVTKITEEEIKRIARPLDKGGCRFTYHSDHKNVIDLLRFYHSIGVIIEHRVIFKKNDLPDEPGDEPGNRNSHVVVVEIRKLITLDGPMFV